MGWGKDRRSSANPSGSCNDGLWILQTKARGVELELYIWPEGFQAPRLLKRYTDGELLPHPFSQHGAEHELLLPHVLVRKRYEAKPYAIAMVSRLPSMRQ